MLSIRGRMASGGDELLKWSNENFAPQKANFKIDQAVSPFEEKRPSSSKLGGSTAQSGSMDRVARPLSLGDTPRYSNPIFRWRFESQASRHKCV